MEELTRRQLEEVHIIKRLYKERGRERAVEYVGNMDYNVYLFLRVRYGIEVRGHISQRILDCVINENFPKEREVKIPILSSGWAGF